MLYKMPVILRPICVITVHCGTIVTRPCKNVVDANSQQPCYFYIYDKSLTDIRKGFCLEFAGAILTFAVLNNDFFTITETKVRCIFILHKITCVLCYKTKICTEWRYRKNAIIGAMYTRRAGRRCRRILSAEVLSYSRRLSLRRAVVIIGALKHGTAFKRRCRLG